MYSEVSSAAEPEFGSKASGLYHINTGENPVLQAIDEHMWFLRLGISLICQRINTKHTHPQNNR
jgi:hypothetical protein